MRETKSGLMKNPTEEKKERRCDAQAEEKIPLYRRYLVILSKPDYVLKYISLKVKNWFKRTFSGLIFEGSIASLT